MTKTKQFFILITVANMLICIVTLLELHGFVGHIRQFVAYDIDEIRAQYVQDSNFFFSEGCRQGVEYVPSAKKSPGFDTNSPMNYCNQKRQGWQEYILDTAVLLGKKSK